MTAAGWYDDPLTPGGKRYWDGTAWTEATQPPAPPPPVAEPVPTRPAAPPSVGPPMAGPPPFDPGVAALSATSMAADPNKLNDIGDWLGRAFRVLGQQAGPVALLAFAVPFPFFVGAYVLTDQTVGRLTWFIDDGRLEGLSVPLLIATIVAWVVAALAATWSVLSAHHNLYGAHVGVPPAWGDSLAAGLRRTPRFIGIMLLIYVLAYAAFGIPIALIAVIAAANNDLAPLVIPLSILLFLGMMVVAFYASVKLVFLTVSSAVVPRGTSALKASWNTTSGWFWAILGRLLLVGLIVGLASAVVQIAAQLLAPVILFSRFDIGQDGDILLDGQTLDTLEILRLADAMPSPLVVIIYMGLVAAGLTALQAVSSSATSALYADANGPNSFGHGQQT